MTGNPVGSRFPSGARPKVRARTVLTALLLSGASVMAGCTPLYLPPVPEPLEVAPRFDLEAVALVEEGRPVLRIELLEVPAAGWLAVQWFSPANREAASESLWVEPGDEGRVLQASLPQDVEPVSGRWRAVVSRDGVLVRQVSVELE